MKSISILGCGWLGKALALNLTKNGYMVRGSTTNELKLEELKSLGINSFQINFGPYVQGHNISDFFSSDVLVITIPPKRKSGQTELYLQQIAAIRDEALRGQISNVVFISSTSVYPDLNKTVVEEDADKNAYLVQAENIMCSSSKCETTVIRFGGLVGPGRHPGKFLAGKKDLSGANAPVNLIHLLDCIDIIKAVIEQEAWNKTFNACADIHLTRKEFYTEAAKALQLEPPQFIEQDSTPFKIVSNEKIKKVLGYKFRSELILN